MPCRCSRKSAGCRRCPDDGIEIAVAVEIGEARNGYKPTSTPANGLARRSLGEAAVAVLVIWK